MLELLQKTLLYIEEQNEWLSYIQSTIQEKEQHYKSLHFIISKQIQNEMRKEDVMYADDATMEQDEVVVKEECCDFTDSEVTPIITFQEPSEVTSNVDDGTIIDQLENDKYWKDEKNGYDLAIIKGEHYHEVTEEDIEHRVGVGIGVSTNHHAIKHNGESSTCIENITSLQVMNSTNENIEVDDEESEKDSTKEKTNRYRCGYCSKTFLQKSKLKRHTRIHTVEKPYNCNFSNKPFTQTSNQIRHLQAYTDEKPLKCEYCQMSFRIYHCLIVHLRTHTGEKPYKCNYCEKSFSRLYNRNVHLRIHTGEKPYKCKYCEKSFRHNQHLNRHLRFHTDE